jgi:hypothetical protein
MVDIKERTNMSITLRPSDDYMELEYGDTHELDKLLNECYPYDADIEEYPGRMVDNYIGYHPATQFIKLQHDTIVRKSGKRNYRYIVILEKQLDDWTSNQIVILTDDAKFVKAVQDELE